MTLPTGDRRSYVSDGATTGQLRLLAEASLVALSLRATAGVKLRSSERTYLDEEFSHTLPWGAGLAFQPRVLGFDTAGRWQWLAEVHGEVALAPELAAGPQSPALAGFAARCTMGDLSVIGGAELPIGEAVGTPKVRIVLGIGWAPRFSDADGDRIEDDQDECPELPEDRDGFEDEDGCPELDNDEDGVADNQDRCAGAAEDMDGIKDDDGCPDPDNDADGIPDELDGCPNLAGPEVSYQRGCPTRDTDQDGLLDLDDCPKQPEDRDEFADDDGCPDLTTMGTAWQTATMPAPATRTGTDIPCARTATISSRGSTRVRRTCRGTASTRTARESTRIRPT